MINEEEIIALAVVGLTSEKYGSEAIALLSKIIPKKKPGED